MDGHLVFNFFLLGRKGKINQNKISKISTKLTPNQKTIKTSEVSGRHEVSSGEMSDVVTLYSREINKFDYLIRLGKCNKRTASAPALLSLLGYSLTFSSQATSLLFFLAIHCASHQWSQLSFFSNDTFRLAFDAYSQSGYNT